MHLTYPIEERDWIASQTEWVEEMPLAFNVRACLWHLVYLESFEYYLNFENRLSWMPREEPDDWEAICDSELDYVLEAFILEMTGEYARRSPGWGFDFVAWYSPIFVPNYDVYCALGSDKSDLDNKQISYADPHESVIIPIETETINERWSQGKLFNPKINIFFDIEFSDYIVNYFTAYDWQKTIYVWPELIQTTRFEQEETGKVERFWRRLLNISPYHFVTSIMSIYFQNRRLLYRAYTPDRPRINWILVPSLFTYDWPHPKPSLPQKYVGGRQIKYFRNLVYFPKTYFPLTRFQVVYAVRHYMLQLIEQLYFERWYMWYDRGILKSDIYYDTLNKVLIRLWAVNRLPSDAWVALLTRKKLVEAPSATKKVLVYYTQNELTRALLSYVMEAVSPWWLKSLYTRRHLAFRLRTFHLGNYRYMRRTIPTLRFLLTCVLYTSQHVLLITKTKPRKYGHLFRDNLMWLIYKLNRGELRRHLYDWSAAPKIITEPWTNVNKEVQETLFKSFFHYYIPRIYLDDHFYLFQNIQEELYHYTGEKKFTILKKKHRPSMRVLYNFVINYYISQLKLFLYTGKKKSAIWNPKFYHQSQNIVYSYYKRFPLLYWFIRLTYRLVYEHCYRTKTPLPECWEMMNATHYVGKFYQPNISDPNKYYTHLSWFTMLDWDWNELNFRFQTDKYLTLVFDRLEYQNLFWHQYSFFYHPAISPHSSAQVENPNPDGPILEYSHGRVRIRYRAFNYKYFAAVKSQETLIRWFKKNFAEISKIEKLRSKRVLFRKVPKRETLHYSILQLNMLSALYHLERHRYLLTVGNLAKQAQGKISAGIRTKKFDTTRKYSVLLGWENWERHFKSPAL